MTDLWIMFKISWADRP